VEALGDRVDVVLAQRVDPVEYELQVGLCLLVVHCLLLLAAENTTGPHVNAAGRCALTASEPLRARAQPEW
jgi:hypothetical protein